LLRKRFEVRVLMLFQIHHCFRKQDYKHIFLAQEEINSKEEMNKFARAIYAKYGKPEGANFYICNEKGSEFIQHVDNPETISK